MRTLILALTPVTAFIVPIFALAQSASPSPSEIETAFKSGKIASLLWQKDVNEVSQLSPFAYVLRFATKEDGNAIRPKFEKLAAQLAGKTLFAQEIVSDVEEHHSALDHYLFKNNEANSQSIGDSKAMLFTSVHGNIVAGTPLTEDETEEQLAQQVLGLAQSTQETISTIAALKDLLNGAAQGGGIELAPGDQPSSGKFSLLTTQRLKDFDYRKVMVLENDHDHDVTELLTDSANVPVVIDFNATWCGPCKRLSPLLEQVAQRLNGKVRFVSIDIDEHAKLAGELTRTRYVPEVRVYKSGDQTSVQIPTGGDVDQLLDLISQAAQVRLDETIEPKVNRQ